MRLVGLYIYILSQGPPNFIVRRPHKLVHNNSEGRTSYLMCFGICYILPNQQIFRKHVIYSLLTNAFAGQMKWLRGPHLARGP